MPGNVRARSPGVIEVQFEAAREGERSGAVLEGLARAHYLRTDYPTATATYEDAYATYRRESNRLGAARVARMLAWITGNVFGEWAVRAGWIGRSSDVAGGRARGGPRAGVGPRARRPLASRPVNVSSLGR